MKLKLFEIFRWDIAILSDNQKNNYGNDRKGSYI
jgi:hypothetical protein